MADEIEYKLDNVEATAVAPDDIDKTFRSSSIGTEAGAQRSKKTHARAVIPR